MGRPAEPSPTKPSPLAGALAPVGVETPPHLGSSRVLPITALNSSEQSFSTRTVIET